MSSSVSIVDALIKEYLVFRGFTSTLKYLEVDLRQEKERGFKVDKVVDHIIALLNAFELSALRELWEHLNVKVFVVLDKVLSEHATKLENDLYKMYLVQCVQSRRVDKATEFFEFMAQGLHQVDSWHEWFGMPYLQKPHEHSHFKMYFTKDWQENFLVSLSNFLSVAFHQMHVPTLLSYFAEHKQNVHQTSNSAEHSSSHVSSSLLKIHAPPPDIIASAEVMDDFYVIAQESPSTPNNKSFASAIKKKFASSKSDLSTGSRTSLRELKQ